MNNLIYGTDQSRCISQHAHHRFNSNKESCKFGLNSVNPDKILQITCIYLGLYRFSDAARYYALHPVIGVDYLLVVNLKEFRILLAFSNVIVGLPRKIDDRT